MNFFRFNIFDLPYYCVLDILDNLDIFYLVSPISILHQAPNYRQYLSHHQGYDLLYRSQIIDDQYLDPFNQSIVQTAANQYKNKKIFQEINRDKIEGNVLKYDLFDPEKVNRSNIILSVNKPHLLNLLLDRKCDPNIRQNNTGNTLLIIAAKKNNLGIVRCLVRRVPQTITVKNNTGMTALMMACRYNSVDVLHHLVDSDVLIDEQNNKGETALMWEIKNLELVDRLIGSKPWGANCRTDIVDQNNNTALLRALMARPYNEDVITLLALHSDLEQTRNNITPLFWADYRSLPILIEARANVNHADGFGMTMMMHLLMDPPFFPQLTHTIDSMICSTANLSLHNLDNWTPLIFACHKYSKELEGARYVQIIKLLLENNADPNVKPDQLSDKFFHGGSPLHIVVSSRKDIENDVLSVCRLLLQHRADPNILDAKDNTAIMRAATFPKNDEVIEMLLNQSNLLQNNRFGENILDIDVVDR